jgi:hypothetical protein
LIVKPEELTMSRTITALFDTRADAEAGAQRLRDAGVDATHVRVHDNDTHTGTASDTTTGAYATDRDVNRAYATDGTTIGDYASDTDTRVHDRNLHTDDQFNGDDKHRHHGAGHGGGLWASIKNAFVPHEDRHTYEEGLRRGGFLLTADVDDDRTPAAVQALEAANSIDLDARTAQWRSEGWDYTAPATDLDRVDDTMPYGTRESGLGGARYRSYTSDRT